METLLFACYNKNKSERLMSSSGGVYPIIAKKVLDNGGVIFAVCYDSQFETIHKKIENFEEIKSSQGSKYIPSKLNDTFKEIKSILKDGRLVMFVGTPCQCGGLISFLGEMKDNLICVDFVCHGVPSRRIWRNYLNGYVDSNNLNTLNMRDKTLGWSHYNYNWKFTFNSGEEKVIPQSEVKYMNGFTRDYYLRPSCYECRFKGIERCTDITLGDYWGVWDVHPDMDDNLGTSLVLVHSQKGLDLFDSVKNSLIRKETSVENAVKCNPSIISSAGKNNSRKEFFGKFNDCEDFNITFESVSKVTFAKKIMRKSKQLLKKVLKK